MTRSHLRALGRKLGYDTSPTAERGGNVLRERAALGDQLRANFERMLWEYLTTRLPPGERPPRRLRRAPFGELSDWASVHAPQETKRLGEGLRLGARQCVEEYQQERKARRERDALEATGERAGP